MIMDKQRQGEQKGHDMEELQASDLAIWGVEKLIFSINSKWRSKTMVL
jgi:hypothetical protein